jgi:hypothetical protein
MFYSQCFVGFQVMELQQDLREHSLVLETLATVAGDRKAWRKGTNNFVMCHVESNHDLSVFFSDHFLSLSGSSVGGVLVERNAEHCRGAVSANAEAIAKMIEELSKQWEIK